MKFSLPESTATKRTQTLSKIGLIIYFIHGLIFILGGFLFLMSSTDTLLNKLITILIIIGILYIDIYKPLARLYEVYEYGFTNYKQFTSFIAPTITGIVAPFLILLPIFNIIIAIHFYYQIQNTTSTD